MKSPFCSHFLDKVRILSETSVRTSVAVFMVFWSDGFDATQSAKRNRHSAWILTVTFFFFDIANHALYLVKSCLVAIGPGKGAAESKEDHTCIFEKLRYDLEAINNNFDGTPIPFTFASRAHDGILCDFYLCKEILFTKSSVKVNSSVHIMDNPERRANFGLYAGNSNNHSCFGLSCNFTKLKLPFEACKRYCKEIKEYCIGECWMDEE